MAFTFPYTFISCPCSDVSRRALTSKRSSTDVDFDQEIQDEETFDPRHPRSAFSLFPPEYLLYCEECHDIKCPRCVTEEINAIYCPDCLFESPKAMMITTSLGGTKDGPFILNCNYCMWNTLDVGIKLDKATSIRSQLDEISNKGRPKPSTTISSPYSGHDEPRRKSSLSQPPFSPGNETKTADSSDAANTPMDAPARFDALKAFYKEQIASISDTDAGFPTSALDINYSSPSSLQRIMNIYTNRENSLKRARQKPSMMREARTTKEGLSLAEPSQPFAYDASTTPSQRLFQHPSFIGDPDAQKVSDLRPMPTMMRTKRSKRCAACKHILTRPEVKISSSRWRIKLIALNYIPYVTVKPLPVSGGLPPPGPDGDDAVLNAGKTVQFVMTLRNPLFEDVSVSLGSPGVTPGKHGHRVTILCPQFLIGRNSDAWDDALNNPPNRGLVNAAGGEQIAGKLYEQGRNWASVVLEIVPASIVGNENEALAEDEDVIEIPIRVRLEWTVTDEDAGIERRKKEKLLDEGEDANDGRRELSYWMVIGIGRVQC